jgi:hypothetical protein
LHILQQRKRTAPILGSIIKTRDTSFEGNLLCTDQQTRIALMRNNNRDVSGRWVNSACVKFVYFLILQHGSVPVTHSTSTFVLKVGPNPDYLYISYFMVTGAVCKAV